MLCCRTEVLCVTHSCHLSSTTLQGPDLACTIGGLRAGCSYMARAAAVSQAGAGSFGPAAMLQTSPSTPGECLACGCLRIKRDELDALSQQHTTQHHIDCLQTAQAHQRLLLGSRRS